MVAHSEIWWLVRRYFGLVGDGGSLVDKVAYLEIWGPPRKCTHAEVW